MDIFDCHYHIEENQEEYDLDVVGRNVIFNFILDYNNHKHKLKDTDSLTLVLDCFEKNNREFVLEEFNSGRVNAVKINSRDQGFPKEVYPQIFSTLEKIPAHLPIIYDAFYFSHILEHQPSLKHLIDLCVQFPDRKFIVAHSGGYEVLKYFFHLRTLPNVYYDLSLSLLYLNDSSCFLDLVKLIKYTDKSKIMFGTDYFWAPAKAQKDIFDSIIENLKISDFDAKKMYCTNAKELFLRE